MRSDATTVTEYLDGLPDSKRKVIADMRKFLKQHMPKGYKETTAWGGICYVIPLEKFPDTYNKQPLGYVALAAQKNYNALYLMCAYGSSKDAEKLKERFKAAGKRLDMGKACIRFKSMDDLDLDVIGELLESYTPDKWIEIYMKSRRI
jgi:hypothetical protein